jgi:hypothetical protein
MKNNVQIITDLNHNPASYLTDAYHSVDSRKIITEFNNVGFKIVGQEKNVLRMPVNPEHRKTFSLLSFDQQNEELATYQRKLERYNARLGHEKHMIRFQSNELTAKTPGHNLFLRVSNSYDGSSSLRISLDILRLVCLNGLVAPRSIFEFAVTHRSKDIYADAIDAAYKIIEKKEIVDNQISKMIGTVLTEDKKIALVDGMFNLRFPDTKWALSNDQKLDLLIPQRQAENNDNLYQNFNTVQEKFTKGSRAVMLNAQGQAEIRKIREVKGQVTADEFNDKSWSLALSLAA